MNPNVDVVDILSVRELSSVPIGLATADWLGLICDPGPGPNTGTSYKATYEVIAGIISAVIGSGIIEPDRVYIVGRGQPNDPVTGGDTVTDTFLDGKVYSLELRGLGFLEKGVEWDNDVVGGGWRLLGGVTFEEGVFYTVHFHPQISPIISTPGAIGKFVDGIQLISSNTTLTSGTYRKLIVLTNGYQVTLGATYPENVILAVTHNGPSNTQGTLIAPAGHSFAFNNGSPTSLWLGRNERVGLIRSGTVWYVAYDTMGYDKVGLIVPGRLPGANQIIAQGQTLLRGDYPRVLDYINRLSAAYPGTVLNAAQWALNKTFWGVGDGSTTMQVPDLRGYFPRWLDLGAGIDADRVSSALQNKPGSAEGMKVESHNHVPEGAGDFKNALSINGQGTVTSFDPGGGNQPDLRVAFPINPYGGSETRPINAAELPLIYI